MLRLDMLSKYVETAFRSKGTDTATIHVWQDKSKIAYNNRHSMTSLYSFLPVNSLLLGIFEGFTSTTSSPSLVLVSKQQIKAILRLYFHFNSDLKVNLFETFISVLKFAEVHWTFQLLFDNVRVEGK